MLRRRETARGHRHRSGDRRPAAPPIRRDRSSPPSVPTSPRRRGPRAGRCARFAPVAREPERATGSCAYRKTVQRASPDKNADRSSAAPRRVAAADRRPAARRACRADRAEDRRVAGCARARASRGRDRIVCSLASLAPRKGLSSGLQATYQRAGSRAKPGKTTQNLAPPGARGAWRAGCDQRGNDGKVRITSLAGKRRNMGASLLRRTFRLRRVRALRSCRRHRRPSRYRTRRGGCKAFSG